MKGLTSKEVLERINENKVNIVKNENSKTLFDIFFGNIFTFFNILTFGIAIWLWIIGAYMQTLFLGVIIINMSIGIFQEIKAKKTLESLKILTKEKAVVVRDNKEVEIDQSEIVLDDLIYYNIGKQIAVDGVLVDGNIACDESLLTGEADRIYKNIGDRVLAGSFVTQGSGYIKVTNLGQETYVNKLTNEAKKYQKPKSEIFNSLKLIMRVIGIIIIPLGCLLLLLSLRTNSIYDASIQTAAALIGMIPSGLFLLTTTALAVSVVKLAKQKTLVQELYCIEMLARVDLICLDKTGTLTDGEISLKNAEFISDEAVDLLAFYLKKSSDDSRMIKILKKKYSKTKKEYKVIKEIPFSSENKYSQLILDNKILSLGAPDRVLKDKYDDYKQKIEEYIDQGYRVILFAEDYKPLAYILFEDNIRKTASETINYFQTNEVEVKIITGDFPKTASLIGLKVGIKDANKYIDISNLSDDELVQVADKYTVFGRSNPNQKQVLIKAFKNQGHKVAMTGDGVNDILALKEADTSIAMASGSEAARNVSHLVLLDNDFSHMPDIVFEGRRVINNIEKVASLFLTKTGFSILLSIFTLFLFKKYPFIPLQLSVISFFAIGTPSFILAFRPNKNRIKGNFLKNILKRAIPASFLILFAHILIFILSKKGIISNDTMASVGYYVTALILIDVLINVSKPYTKFSISLIITMISGVLLSPILITKSIEILPIYRLELNAFLVIFGGFVVYPIYIFILRWIVASLNNKKSD
ncbi:HAD-IC family P-type ATPase [Haploplasma axanthum]|uniref:Calcium-transporting ATPase lmo0841 n=1 Tax=Haploplasma axanthum TaxID=29552 RepID=A0A449BEP6_HAPAX|nr:HAD-IC family P-type ATPase [Haploplasma axanthum]VEU80906.1 Calcium-transporting ATPase lmo0841 [Haploplasma axanthum]